MKSKSVLVTKLHNKARKRKGGCGMSRRTKQI